PNGPSRCTRSPWARNASRLVVMMWTPGAPLSTCSAKEAAASMTCSQLSSTSSIFLSRSNATNPGNGVSEWIANPSTKASALGTSSGSARGARSTKRTPLGADKFVWTLGQSDQYVQRTASEADQLTILQE